MRGPSAEEIARLNAGWKAYMESRERLFSPSADVLEVVPLEFSSPDEKPD